MCKPPSVRKLKKIKQKKKQTAKLVEFTLEKNPKISHFWEPKYNKIKNTNCADRASYKNS